MRRNRRIGWFWRLALVWLVGMLAAAGEEAPSKSVIERAATAESRVPGVGLAEGITELTGVAISPMLGVSAVGVYRYWRTDEALRGELPWYAQPWAWGTGLAVVGLCFLKDTLGTTVPGLLKKPLDLIEMFESQASALLVSGAFVPLLIREMVEGRSGGVAAPMAWIGGGGAIASVAGWWWWVPLGLLVFGVVWLMFHAFQVLLLLSPFSTLDAVIKGSRTGLMLLLGLLYLIAPWLAAAFCVVLIAVACWLAPKTWRLAVFGSRVGGDLLFGPWMRLRADLEEPRVAVAGVWSGQPARSIGRLVKREEGGLVLRVRRGWGGWKVVKVPLPEGRTMVERGLLMPSLVSEAEDGWVRRVWFLPRYRGREAELVERFGWGGVREHAVKRGWAAAKEWLGSVLGRRKSALPSSPSP